VTRDLAADLVFHTELYHEVRPLTKFWPAEKYHQDYFRLNPHAGYCSYVIAPKVKKLKQAIEGARK
jgi:peptide-methionine (S)-S-oxide reductase